MSVCRFLIYCRGWGVRWSLGSLIRLAMVLRHLYAILIFVLLNMFVALRICGEMYVNVARFLFLLSCGVVRFVLCSVWYLSLCITVGGKLFCWAMWRVVDHSLFCCTVLSWVFFLCDIFLLEVCLLSDVTCVELLFSYRMEVSSDNTLIIMNVLRNNEGNYSCHVRNSFGSDEIMYFLQVQGNPIVVTSWIHKLVLMKVWIYQGIMLYWQINSYRWSVVCWSLMEDAAFSSETSVAVYH